MDTVEQEFSESITELGRRINLNAKDKGFYNPPRKFGETIALIHSELSEALEGYRHNNPPSEHIPEFTAVEEEFADVIIRLLDEAYESGMRLGPAVAAKMEFNASRPFKHGGKVI